MDTLVLIVALSTIIWYLINRAKEELWSNLSFGKWITIAVAAILSFTVVFAFNLDLIFALNLTPEISLVGKILTGLVLMSGSSAVSEIMEAVGK